MSGTVTLREQQAEAVKLDAATACAFSVGIAANLRSWAMVDEREPIRPKARTTTGRRPGFATLTARLSGSQNVHADLFQVTVPPRALANVPEGELDVAANSRKYRRSSNEDPPGFARRSLQLDIRCHYRVRPARHRLRQWATTRPRTAGRRFTLDDEHRLGGPSRTTSTNCCRHSRYPPAASDVLSEDHDIYATSIDYDSARDDPSPSDR